MSSQFCGNRNFELILDSVLVDGFEHSVELLELFGAFLDAFEQFRETVCADSASVRVRIFALTVRIA